VLNQLVMRICGFEARIVSCHTPLPVRRERNFPKKEEPVVLGLSIAENGRDKGDSTAEVPVQKVKTAIRGLSKKTYGVLSHVPSCRAYADLRRSLRRPYGPGLIGDIDTLIAATALERNLTVVTIDTDFQRVPNLRVILLSRTTMQVLSRP
jgi:hypothetical protein